MSPEGGVLSPFLWKLFDTFKKDLKASLHTCICIWYSYATNRTGRTRQRYHLRNFFKIHEKNKIMVQIERTSAVKTLIIFRTKSNTIEKPKSIRINDITIEVSSTVKYLAVTLDDKLNWNELNIVNCHSAQWHNGNYVPKRSEVHNSNYCLSEVKRG